MPSFSLVGALEFRRVVSSLQRDAASASLSRFESPLTPYSYHRHRHSLQSGSRTPSRSPISHFERDPWDAALGVPLDERPPPPQIVETTFGDSLHEGYGHTPIPSISHTPASPISSAESDTESQTYVEVPLSRRQRVFRFVAHVGHILFPTLHEFWSKSFLGKIAAVLAAPAVLALTLTLPVVVTSYENPDASEKRHSMGGTSVSPLVDFEEEGVERALIAEEEVEEEMHELKFNKWLMAVQCCLGPLFCAAVLLGACYQLPDLPTRGPWYHQRGVCLLNANICRWDGARGVAIASHGRHRTYHRDPRPRVCEQGPFARCPARAMCDGLHRSGGLDYGDRRRSRQSSPGGSSSDDDFAAPSYTYTLRSFPSCTTSTRRHFDYPTHPSPPISFYDAS